MKASVIPLSEMYSLKKKGTYGTRSDQLLQIIPKFDSSVGIALGYGLHDRYSRVLFPAEAGNFSLHHRVQNGSGAHPASLSNGYQGLSPWG
jgi:hypothetical protein